MPVRSSAWRRSANSPPMRTCSVCRRAKWWASRMRVSRPPGSSHTSVAPASTPSSGEMSPTRITIASPPASAPARGERAVAAEADQVEPAGFARAPRRAPRSRSRGGAARSRAPSRRAASGSAISARTRYSSRRSRSATSASSRIRRGSPSPGRTIRIAALFAGADVGVQHELQARSSRRTSPRAGRGSASPAARPPRGGSLPPRAGPWTGRAHRGRRCVRCRRKVGALVRMEPRL